MVAIGLESFSLRTAVRESNHVRQPGTSWWRFIRGTKQPELPVVLLEDVGALTGLFFALGGVLMAHFTEDARWDAVGSISIGVLLIVIAAVLAIEMKSLLIGESASADTRDAIVGAIESSAHVDRLIHLRTEHIGPDEVLVGAKVEYASTLSADQLVAAINSTEDAIRAAVPSATVIYLEPDLHRSDHPDLLARRTDRRTLMAERLSGRALGLLAMTVAVVSFSTSSVLIKWSESTGSVIAFWRMIGAVIGWWTVIAFTRVRSGRPAPTASTWRLALAPGLAFGANIALFFTAITKTSIAHAEFITALTPLVMLPAGAFFFGERPNWNALRWGLISIVGVSLVLFFGPDQGASSLSGDLLMLGVITLWTTYLLTSKRARAAGINTLDFMACMMPIGVLTAGPIAAIIAGTDVFGLRPRAGSSSASSRCSRACSATAASCSPSNTSRSPRSASCRRRNRRSRSSLRS